MHISEHLGHKGIPLWSVRKRSGHEGHYNAAVFSVSGLPLQLNPSVSIHAFDCFTHRATSSAIIPALSAHIRAMSREDVGGGVEVVLGEIDGGAGFAETGRDQLELPGERADVAGGEDAGAAGLHHAVNLDLPAFDFQAPVFYRTEIGFKADVHQDVIDIE